MSAARASLSAAAIQRSLIAISASIAIVGITLGLTFPLLSLMLERAGTSSAMIGFNAAATGVGMIVGSPFIPRLIRRLGAMPMMVGAAALSAAMIALLGTFVDVYAWFPIRFVLGLASASLFTTGETWLNEIAPAHLRGRIVAMYATVLSVGFAVGPTILLIVGSDGVLPFVTAFAITCLALVPLILARGLAPPMGHEAGSGMLAVMVAAPFAVGGALMFGWLEGSATALLPVYGVRNGLSETSAALLLTAVISGSIVLQYPLGWLADLMPRRRILLLCGVVSTLCMAALPFTLTTPGLLWLVLFLWGGFLVGLYTVGMALLGERFRGGALAQAMAAISLLYALGNVVGPALGGQAMVWWDPHGLPLALAAVSALYVGLGVLRRTGRG